MVDLFTLPAPSTTNRQQSEGGGAFKKKRDLNSEPVKMRESLNIYTHIHVYIIIYTYIVVDNVKTFYSFQSKINGDFSDIRHGKKMFQIQIPEFSNPKHPQLRQNKDFIPEF